MTIYLLDNECRRILQTIVFAMEGKVMNIKNDVSLNATQLQAAKSRAYHAADHSSTAEKSSGTSQEDSAVVYESNTSKDNVNEYDKATIIKQLAQESENRVNQFKNLVESMFQKQGIKIQNADDMWNILARGEFTVTPEEKAEAQAAIAEDGYWGVNQTSERIFEFAKSLSGGDVEKADLLLDAFKEGYQQATKAWGKELPDISKQTYDAVLQKFEDWKNEASGDSSEISE